MKYMILIQSNPSFEQRWAGLTDEQRERFGRDHYALSDELAASGELIVSEALTDPAQSRRITVTDGRVTVSDGPFAEAKEHLAGFYLVDVETQERALQIGARVPDAVWGMVQVRPLLDRTTWDL